MKNRRKYGRRKGDYLTRYLLITSLIAHVIVAVSFIAGCSAGGGSIDISATPDGGVGVGGPVPPPLPSPAVWKKGDETQANFDHNYIRGLAWGGGIYVAVGTNAQGAISNDGITWAAMGGGGLPGTDEYTCVTWEGGTFVAGTVYGEVSTSSDGTFWQPVVTLPGFSASVPIKDIAGGGGTFVAVGEGGNMAELPAGGLWTSINNGGGFSNSDTINGIAFGNAVFVAVGSGGNIARKDTAGGGFSNFTPATSGITSDLLDIAYGNGVFVAVGKSGAITRSSDGGATWAKVNNALTMFGPGNVECRSIAYGSGKFTMTAFKMGLGGKILTSRDGLTWTPTESTCFGTKVPKEIAYGDGKFIAATDAQNPNLGYWKTP